MIQQNDIEMNEGVPVLIKALFCSHVLVSASPSFTFLCVMRTGRIKERKQCKETRNLFNEFEHGHVQMRTFHVMEHNGR